MNSDKKLIVSKIKEGTVIDHIRAGMGLKCINLLNLNENDRIIIATNIKSKKIGNKDIIKIENKELTSTETDTISLISPNATINRIKGYEVVDKRNVHMPEIIEKVWKCINPNCITNSGEPVNTKFYIHDNQLKCHYCERIFSINP